MTTGRTRMTWLNICALIFALLTILGEELQLSTLAHLAKPLTTLLILFMAVKVRLILKDRFGALLLPALLFCLAGDIFLMYEQYFLPGLGAFLVGQLLLAAAFMSKKGPQLHWPSLVALSLGMGSIYAVIAPGLGEMKIPVVIYMFCIGVMSWQALGLYFSDRSRAHGMMALGALLFVLSDSLIALDKFYIAIPYRSLPILGTYWMALGLIVNGAYRYAMGARTTATEKNLQHV